ncbi:hypothetical protein [uncultured Dokdonia sp.]|uniref:hypothetical protein n=1 Tax=uncultured Dokdonia sp. TaxID=575653 RepID=UPI00261580CA|nr:hypothetical protein [uncultured Dokdonia sp.]
MKIFIIVFIISNALIGQNPKYPNSVEEIKKSLEGEWVLDGDDSNEHIHFWFSEKSGGIEYKDVKTDMIIDDHTIVEILKDERQIFWIKFIKRLSSRMYSIQLLNDDYFVFRGEWQDVRYKKIKTTE